MTISMRIPANDRSRVGILLLVLCWIIGDGALAGGLRGTNSDGVAIGIFLAVCITWWAAYKLLLAGGRMRRLLAYFVLLFWALALTLSAIAGKERVYKTNFFLISTCSVLILFAASIIARGPSRKQGGTT